MKQTPTAEKRSLESTVLLLDFKPKRPGEYVIRLRNPSDIPTTASVILHFYSRPD